MTTKLLYEPLIKSYEQYNVFSKSMKFGNLRAVSPWEKGSENVLPRKWRKASQPRRNLVTFPKKIIPKTMILASKT